VQQSKKPSTKSPSPRDVSQKDAQDELVSRWKRIRKLVKGLKVKYPFDLATETRRVLIWRNEFWPALRRTEEHFNLYGGLEKFRNSQLVRRSSNYTRASYRVDSIVVDIDFLFRLIHHESKSLGERLDERRVAKGHKQEALAGVLGCAVSTLSRVVNEGQKPRRALAMRIRDYLDGKFDAALDA
jgi:hypothetical protein